MVLLLRFDFVFSNLDKSLSICVDETDKILLHFAWLKVELAVVEGAAGVVLGSFAAALAQVHIWVVGSAEECIDMVVLSSFPSSSVVGTSFKRKA